MKLLVDNALSPVVAARLRERGHDAIHLRDRNLQSAEDERVFELAASENRVLLSADTDFAAILAHRQANAPSVILLRKGTPRQPEQQARLLLANLDGLDAALKEGSIAIIEGGRIRIRHLPLPPAGSTSA